jgi:ABC-2 type transport system permease protein
MSTLVIGSALWSYVMTTLRVFIFLLLGVVVFTLDLSDANYPAALLILLLSIVAFASIGIIAAGIIMVIKRGEPLTSLFSAFANLVGGIYYPVAILPDGLQLIARLLPITYAVRAMRLALLTGATWQVLLPDIVALLIFIVVLFPLALLIFQRAVERARIEGSLAHY